MSSDTETITGAQIRAARSLVRWSAQQLSKESGIGLATIRRAEAVDGVPPVTLGNRRLIRLALESAGVMFLPADGGGPGVRLKRPPPADTV